jgi:hypothetical protein
MNIITILAGLILLFSGRKLYWLFVAVVGFIAGYILTGEVLPEISTVLRIIIGLVAGAIGAALLLVLHQVAVGLAGFLGGGLLALQITHQLGVGSGEFSWVPFILGGIVGAILVVSIFDWALILLTSLGGAFLVISGLNPDPSWANLAILILFVIGVFIQANLLRRQRSQDEK